MKQGGGIAGRGCAVRAVAIFFQFFNRWQQNFFPKFFSNLQHHDCLGCANDGVAAMVVVAAVVAAEKFQNFSKNFNFFLI